MRTGTLYGVNVGPGDPELMTLKAVRVIRDADVVALPDTGNTHLTAGSIARDLLHGKERLLCATPMTLKRESVRAAHQQTADSICALLDKGKDVAYLCLGDVSIYSSFTYVHELVQERGYETEIVPGVTSFCVAAARLKTTLCQGSERLIVAPADDSDLDALLDQPATKVLMKPGRDQTHLRERLCAHGLMDMTSAVERCGLPDERVVANIADTDNLDYLSVYIVHPPYR